MKIHIIDSNRRTKYMLRYRDFKIANIILIHRNKTIEEKQQVNRHLQDIYLNMADTN